MQDCTIIREYRRNALNSAASIIKTEQQDKAVDANETIGYLEKDVCLKLKAY